MKLKSDTVTKKKFSNYTIEQKKDVLIELIHHNEFVKILNIIPKKISKTKINFNDPLEIYFYTSFLRTLSLFGSSESVVKKIKQLIHDIPIEKYNLSIEWANVSLNISSILIESGEHTVAIDFCSKIISSTNIDEKIKLKLELMMFQSIYVENGEANYQEFLRIKKEIKESFKDQEKMLEYVELIDFIAHSYLDFESITNEDEIAFLKKLEDSKYYRINFYVIFLGYYYRKKNSELKSILFEMGKLKNKFSIHNLLAYLMYSYLLDSKSVTLEERILLHMFPVSNISSFIMGNQFRDSGKNQLERLKRIHKDLLFMKLNEENLTDWLITQDDVVAKNYFDIHQELVLDLHIGAWFKSPKERILLSQLRSRALMLIIGSSYKGISIHDLAFMLFPGENLDMLTLYKRTQDIVTQLIKLKFPIARGKGIVRFKLDGFNYDIIFPRNFQTRELVDYFYKKNSILTFQIIMHEFNLSKAQSFSYLKKWKEKKLIISCGRKEYKIKPAMQT